MADRWPTEEDDHERRQEQQRRRRPPFVSLEQGCKVRDRAKCFGVSEDALRKAVARVGHKVDDVQRELGGRR